MSTHEPGTDERDWRTEWELLEPMVVDSPGEALPEVDALIEDMMRARGLPVEEEAAREAAEPEVVAEFLEARRVTRLLERGEDVEPGDVGAAITGYRSLFDYLLDEPATGGPP